MSGWIVAVREVYAAGGRVAIRDLTAPLDDITVARQKGMLEPGIRGPAHHMAVITEAGRALCEGRAELYVPVIKSDTGGRPHGSHRRLRATWLAALPRTNEVRI
jgi:hypothetical protein